MFQCSMTWLIPPDCAILGSALTLHHRCVGRGWVVPATTWRGLCGCCVLLERLTGHCQQLMRAPMAERCYYKMRLVVAQWLGAASGHKT